MMLAEREGQRVEEGTGADGPMRGVCLLSLLLATGRIVVAILRVVQDYEAHASREGIL